jgi:N-dimethylarginine dimethylaminohydrolase
MNPINFNAPWHPLRHVWVGASYAPEFYAPIRNTQIRDCLQKIARETEEDYLNLVETLKSFDIKVDRPQIDPALNIMHYVDQQGQVTYDTSQSFTLIPKPPMQPRDSTLIVGNTIIESNSESKWFGSLIDQLNLRPDQKIANPDIIFDAPEVTVIGKHLIVDCRNRPELADYVQTIFPDRQVVPVQIGGHNDAVFCPVRPGLIVSTYHHTNYADTFPNWTVKHIENQSWNAIPDWRKFKHANVNKWWIPEQDNNAEFGKFVDTWLDHWLGYVAETVFDVNMLQINEHTILVNNYNKEMFEFFKTHGIEPIITPFRHRFFWDGGIHCITNDIYREGSADVYITR